MIKFMEMYTPYELGLLFELDSFFSEKTQFVGIQIFYCHEKLNIKFDAYRIMAFEINAGILNQLSKNDILEIGKKIIECFKQRIVDDFIIC